MLVADTFLEMEVFVSYGLAPLLPAARPSAIGEHVMGSLAFFVCGGFFSAHAGPLQVDRGAPSSSLPLSFSWDSC